MGEFWVHLVRYMFLLLNIILCFDKCSYSWILLNIVSCFAMNNISYLLANSFLFLDMNKYKHIYIYSFLFSGIILLYHHMLLCVSINSSLVSYILCIV